MIHAHHTEVKAVACTCEKVPWDILLCPAPNPLGEPQRLKATQVC